MTEASTKVKGHAANGFSGNCGCLDIIDLDIIDVYNKSVNYLMKKVDERKAWLLSVLNVGGGENLTSGVPNNIALCQKCFAKYYSITERTMQRRREESKSGISEAHVGKRRGVSRSCLAAKPWLENYAKSVGDSMPDFDEVHLPDYKWAWVHRKMKKEFAMRMPPTYCPVYGTFMLMRRKECRRIKIRKLKRFAKCKTCTDLKLATKKASGVRRAQLEVEFNDHIAWEKIERAKYYKHKEKSK